MGRPSGTHSQSQHGINEDDKEKMISDAVFYFLVADQKKSIIKRADLCKHCDLSKKERKLQEEVISEAMRLLLKTFGIRVIEPEQKKGTYYLINALTEPQEDEDQQHITWSDKENAQLGLTFVILGVVFMSNGKISEENLFKFLKHLGIYEEDRNKKRGGGDSSYADSQVDAEITELFDGDVKKFVTDILVSRQHYLKKERVETGDPEAEAYEYSWGERAKLEVKESSILMMVCELYECEPRMFKEQFDKVIASEGEDVLDAGD